MTYLLIKFGLSIFGLIYSSQLLIRSLSRLTKYFKVSLFAVGVVFMAVSTTIPELFLGIDSALQNSSSLALGTVLGSNIADIALVVGILFILLKKVKVSDYLKNDSAWWMIGSVFAPFVLLYDRVLSKVDGLILLAIFLSYVYYIFLSKSSVIESVKKNNKKRLGWDIAQFVIGLVILLFSARYAVSYGSEFAQVFGLPLILIGVSIYALSTSLPELAFEWQAVKQGKTELAFGDIIGSLIANSTLVLGVTALIQPIEIISRSAFLTTGAFLTLLTVTLFYIVRKKISLSWWFGIILIASYIGFLVFQWI